MESYNLIVEHRPLFLNKYEYRAAIRMPGAGFCNHVSSIEEYKEKIDRIRAFWSPNANFRSLRQTTIDYLENIDLSTVDLYLQWRKEYKHIFSFRQESDRVSIFGNDLKKLETIKDIYAKAILTHARVLEPETLYFKKMPKFSYRTYIKSKRTSDDFYGTMRQFIDNNKDNANYKLSPALIRLFSKSKMHRMLHGSYYIDYNQPSIEMYLHLLFPNMLGKKYNCKKHPDN
jgi:hypothetical protein